MFTQCMTKLGQPVSSHVQVVSVTVLCLRLPKSPAHSAIIPALEDGGTYLDSGCISVGDVRWLVVDGACSD